MSDALERIVPYDRGGKEGLYRHDAEGEDDMPAHIKSSLVGASVSIPVRDGKLALGTWQGIWYLEFRRARHTRKVGSLWRSEEEALSQNRLDRFEGFLKYLCFNSGAEPGNKRLTQHMQTKI